MASIFPRICAVGSVYLTLQQSSSSTCSLSWSSALPVSRVLEGPSPDGSCAQVTARPADLEAQSIHPGGLQLGVETRALDDGRLMGLTEA